MRTLTLKILVPTLLALFGGMLLLGAALIQQIGGSVARQMENNAERTASFVAAVSLPYITNYDLTALAGFVKEITRDGDIVYAEFVGADGASLTSDLVPAPPNQEQLMLLQREIKDSSGKVMARFKMGVKRDSQVLAQRTAVMTVIAGIVGVLVVVLIVIVFVVRRAVAPAKEMQAVLAEVAAGNLCIRSKLRTRDEIGAMGVSLNLALDALRQTLMNVGAHAQGVNGAAVDIKTAVGDQATSSSEMSATVVEITSAMEELSASSTQIAEHSKAVVEIANHTWENSKKGSEAMQVVLAKIGDIRAENQSSLEEIVALGSKSKEISKVMVIINAVADQTKLISFNAALEASSAGEAGRRFGVVAAEIRRLADSVTESTSEIESKINEIQDSISRLVITSEKGALGIADGMAATASTARHLGELVAATSQTSNAAQQISLSTQQQKTASNQVVIALREIANSSADTAQAIARISDISHQMADMSSLLRSEVGRFTLTDKNQT